MASSPLFELTEEQRALRTAFASSPKRRSRRTPPSGTGPAPFPIDTVRKLGELGAMGVAFPEEYGGLGAGAVAQALVVEELARIDSSIAVTVGADVSIAGEPILHFGTEEQKQRWLVPLARGEHLGRVRQHRAGRRLRCAGRSTTARRENGCWVINGTKAFTTNAGTEMSAFVIATAKTERRRQDGR